MTPVHAALLRAQLRLVDRLAGLDARLTAGDESLWSAFCEAAVALAAVAPQTAPGAGGRMMTTAEMAATLNVSPKTLLRRAKKGQAQPLRLAARGPAALRWRAPA